MTHAFSDQDIPVCAPPDPYPDNPKFDFPPLACDCHAHICGPQSVCKYIPQRIYSPPDALLPEYRRVLDALGCDRAVLVQPSFYGIDNSAMLAAMKAAGPAFRGVAVIGGDATPRELEAMHEAGIRGARINIVDVREGRGQLPIERIARLADQIKPFGWHIELLMHVDEFPEIDTTFGRLPVDVVFGHLGYVKTEKGIAAPGFQSLLRLLRGGRAWVKLTGAYRISSQPLPHADTNEFACALLDAAPNRIVWGTDWPHVKTKWTIPMPNDGAIANVLLDWIPDAARLRVLADNPATLYGFP
ncbi:MAG TPA: amidohydrolase family protein [Methylocella sp.]|nr:amidohydrolase family protein [Methylocella sp.]